METLTLSNITLVYQDTEIKLTGRKATKHIGTGGVRRTATRGNLDIKVEITPVDISTGSWKKWVKQEDLYIITED